MRLCSFFLVFSLALMSCDNKVKSRESAQARLLKGDENILKLENNEVVNSTPKDQPLKDSKKKTSKKKIIQKKDKEVIEEGGSVVSEANSIETIYLYFEDLDGDGYGNSEVSLEDVNAPEGYVLDGTDCNDNDPNINPDATEICDEDDVDEDCDETTTEDQTAYFLDDDGDGFGDPDSTAVYNCEAPSHYVANDDDCDDDSEDINPDATEVCDDDDVDENCDGNSDDDDSEVSQDSQTAYYEDTDGDGDGDSGSTAIYSCDEVEDYSTNDDDLFPEDPLASTCDLFVPDDYDTIDGALLAAADDELVCVEPGTYAESDIRFYSTTDERNVRLYCLDQEVHDNETDPNIKQFACILDAEESGRVMEILGAEGEEYLTNESVISGFTFTNGVTSDEGGAISIFYGAPLIQKCSFVSNASGASSISGGAIYGTDLSGLTIKDSYFYDNHATHESNGDGGAIAFNSVDGITLDGLHLEGNSGTRHGGGLYFYTSSIKEISNSTFLENSAGENGGGLYFHTCEDVELLKGLDFLSNTAVEDGGGLFLKESVALDLIDLNFESNVASDDGGGLYINNSTAETLEGLTAKANEGVDGGGLVVSGSTISLMADSSITGNTSATSGGGLYFSNVRFVSRNLLVQGNTGTDSHGGGIYIYQGDSRDPNEIYLFDNIALVDNISGDSGGGIYITPRVKVYFRNAIIRGNSATEEGDNIKNRNGKNFYVNYSNVDSSSDSISGDPNWNWWNTSGELVETSINEDCFVSDTEFTLSADSNCVDGGYDEDLYEESYCTDQNDLVGNPRCVDTIDMGPYEYQK